MKKVWKYIVISLLLLLGLCLLGVLYLFFFPGNSLFNITYINMHVTKTSEEFSTTNVSEIELNSRAYKLEIKATEEKTISLKAYSNSFGLVLTKNSTFNISSQIDNGVLTFNVTEPHGFATSNSSYIELYIPSTSLLNLSISNYKAKTLIDSGNLKINDLIYTSMKGDFNFQKGSIKGNLNLNINKGNFKLFDKVSTSDNEVNLRLTSGSFKATESVLGDINIQYNERGVIELNQCEDIRENQKTAGGKIYVNKVSHLSITAGDTIISAKTILTDAVVELTNSGKITIEKVYGSSSIVTSSGDINIGTALGSLILSSTSGLINVSNATLYVSVTVGYGEANINFAEGAESYSSNQNSRVLNASVHNGKLTVTGAEHVGEVVNNSTTASAGGIKITGTGRVYLNMRNVFGNNSIVGNDGDVHIDVNKSSVYTLKTSSVTGNVRVNLTQTIEYKGYTTKELKTTNVNCSSTSSNVLNVLTTNGNLTVFDTNFA